MVTLRKFALAYDLENEITKKRVMEFMGRGKTMVQSWWNKEFDELDADYSDVGKTKKISN